MWINFFAALGIKDKALYMLGTPADTLFWCLFVLRQSFTIQSWRAWNGKNKLALDSEVSLPLPLEYWN